LCADHQNPKENSGTAVKGCPAMIVVDLEPKACFKARKMVHPLGLALSDPGHPAGSSHIYIMTYQTNL